MASKCVSYMLKSYMLIGSQSFQTFARSSLKAYPQFRTYLDPSSATWSQKYSQLTNILKPILFWAPCMKQQKIFYNQYLLFLASHSVFSSLCSCNITYQQWLSDSGDENFTNKCDLSLSTWCSNSKVPKVGSELFSKMVNFI